MRQDIAAAVEELFESNPRVRSDQSALLKRNAVADSGVAAALEDEAELVSLVRVVQQRMDTHAVKENC